MANLKLNINDEVRDLDIDPATPLLWTLRDNLGLTGTKYGCGIAQCGACTVHLDGAAVRSCQIPAQIAEGKQITTIEGLSEHNGAVLQQMWVELNVPQCGYCQSGMLMAAAAMLDKIADPTDSDIDEHMSNICRCGTYPRVKAAIKRAVAEQRG
jgi:isoquinoline 1-oxidoreductase alpha subunit